MENARFAEYTTSGAFNLTLTRNQVSTLAMLDGGAHTWMAVGVAALERKGLAEQVARPSVLEPERVEFRATLAGLLTLALCRQAGLTNGSADPVADEITALRAEIQRARTERADARRAARSSLAKLEEAEGEIANLKAMAQGGKPRIFIRHRDPMPDVCRTELMELVGDPE